MVKELEVSSSNSGEGNKLALQLNTNCLFQTKKIILNFILKYKFANIFYNLNILSTSILIYLNNLYKII